MRDMLQEAFDDAEYVAPCHTPASEVRKLVGRDEVPDVWLFGFVRDPYAWVESIRRYTAQMPDSMLSPWVDDPAEFAHRLHRACEEEHMTLNGPIMLQCRMVLGCDKVYRFEDMESAAQDIGFVIGKVLPLQHKNPNGVPPIAIDGEYREAIATLFALDFKALNYTP